MKKLMLLFNFILFICLTVFCANISFADTSDDITIHYDSNITEDTSSVTITMEAYAEYDPTIPPSSSIPASDVIVVFDQSGSMYQDRDTIIASIESLVRNLPAATYDPADETNTSPEHRVSIIGYGRNNNASAFDSTYRAASTGTVIKANSYNTGIYTYNGGVEFHSTDGTLGITPDFSNYINTISDGSADIVDSSGNVTTSGNPPEVSLHSDVTYNDIFLSTENALNVLGNKDQMCKWDAGASRMDVGMALLQTVIDLKNSDANYSKRPTFVIMVTGTVPVQNNGSSYTSRIGSSRDIVEGLINSGVNFFALGDYHQMSTSNSYDNDSNFETVMNTFVRTPYYYMSLANSTDTEKNERLSKFITIVNSGIQFQNQFKSNEIEITTQSLEFNYAILSTEYDLDLTSAKHYNYGFKEYDSDGNPVFYNTKQLEEYVTLTQNDNILSYTENSLITIPSYDLYNYTGYPTGYKSVVQLTGTKKNYKLIIGTTLNDEMHEFGAISIRRTGSGNTRNLTQSSDGIYVYNNNINNNSYNVYISGTLASKADGTNYTVKSGDVLQIDYYTVNFYDTDGVTSYNSGTYDHDLTHNSPVITGSTITNPEAGTNWYTSPTKQDSSTLFDFSSTITKETKLYKDNGININVITRLDDVNYNFTDFTSVQLFDGTNYIDLTKDINSDGTYTYTANMAAASEYTIYINGVQVTDGQGTVYTVKNKETLILDYYSVSYFNNDGTSYNEQKSDLPYVIKNTVLTNPDENIEWYTSNDTQDDTTKFDFTLPISSKQELYRKRTFDFSFTKVTIENTDTKLGGVEFKIYALTCTNTDPEHIKLHDEIISDANQSCFTLVDTQTSGNTLLNSDTYGVVNFTNLDNQYQYRLVETKTTINRTLPDGEWNIKCVTLASEENENTITIGSLKLNISAVKNPTAIGEYKDADGNITGLYITNKATYVLPLTGYMGADKITQYSLTIASIGLILIFMINKNKIFISSRFNFYKPHRRHNTLYYKNKKKHDFQEMEEIRRRKETLEKISKMKQQILKE